MGCGLMLIVLSEGLTLIIIASAVFAFGTMIAAPLLMDVVHYFATPRLLASYYGFNGYSLGIGGALSTSLGGWFYDKGSEQGFPLLPWLICAIVEIIVQNL